MHSSGRSTSDARASASPSTSSSTSFIGHLLLTEDAHYLRQGRSRCEGNRVVIPAPRCDRHCHGRLDRRRPAPSRRNPGSPDDVRLRRHRETHDRSWPPSQSSRTPAAEGTRHLVTARMAGGGGGSAAVSAERTKARAGPARLQTNHDNTSPRTSAPPGTSNIVWNP